MKQLWCQSWPKALTWSSRIGNKHRKHGGANRFM